MASVQEIIDRLAEEDPYYGLYRPGLGAERTHEIPRVTSIEERQPVSWMPNRKVLSGFVAGAVAWLVLRMTGVELDPAVAEAVAFLVTSAVAYLVPLPEAPAEDGEMQP